MKADYVADVSGLAVVLPAEVPELAPLAPDDRIILLMAIHIGSMRSSAPTDAQKLDFYAFSRQALWHLISPASPRWTCCWNSGGPGFERSWIVTFPRLISRKDLMVERSTLPRRAAKPLRAASDVVLAFHNDDRLFRIHRAALTAPARTTRLCQAVIAGGLHGVRLELEGLLVNNPALIPVSGTGGTAAVEWAAGSVLDGLERLGSALAGDLTAARVAIADVDDRFSRLVDAVQATSPPSSEIVRLLRDGRDALAGLAAAAGGGSPSLASATTLRRRAISAVDQIVVSLSSGAEDVCSK